MTTVKVCFVSSHGQRGGSEAYLRSLLSGLDRDWVASIVVLEDGPLVGGLRDDGYSVVVIPTSGSKIALVRSAFMLRRHLARNPADVVHANGVKAALVATLATVSRREPVVWVKHDFSWDGRLAGLVARRCRLVVGVSSAVLAALPAAVRSQVVPTGVAVPAADVERARAAVDALAGGRPVLVLVGRLDPVKGHLDLLAAAPSQARAAARRKKLAARIR